MASVTRAIRPGRRANAIRTPRVHVHAVVDELEGRPGRDAVAAATGPGARWWMPFMRVEGVGEDARRRRRSGAARRRSPRRCGRRPTATPASVSWRIASSPPGSSGASVTWRSVPRPASTAGRSARRSGARRRRSGRARPCGRRRGTGPRGGSRGPSGRPAARSAMTPSWSTRSSHRRGDEREHGPGGAVRRGARRGRCGCRPAPSVEGGAATAMAVDVDEAGGEARAAGVDRSGESGRTSARQPSPVPTAVIRCAGDGDPAVRRRLRPVGDEAGGVDDQRLRWSLEQR